MSEEAVAVTVEDGSAGSDSFGLGLGMDFEIEKGGITTLFAERLSQSGSAQPMTVFFWRNQRCLSVMGRPTESEEDFIKSIHQMMHLYPALNATSLMLAINSTVKLTDETLSDAVVVIGVSPHGSIAEAFPYRLEEGQVVWDTDSVIDTNQGLYSKVIDHMFPTFMMIGRSIVPPSTIVNYLSVNGFEVEFHGEYAPDTMDAKAFL